MDRLFPTHRIRESRPCDPVWSLTAPDEGGFSHPEKVIVPGVWESLPQLRSYRGRGFYEQKMLLDGCVRFLFGGVSFQAKVYLDDRLICEHYGAYTSFDAVAENTAPGEHVLRVEADNRFGDHSALHVPNDYYSYGGINRPVIVEKLNEAYITGLQVIPVRAETGWEARAAVAVRSLSDQRLSASLSLSAAGKSIREDFFLPARETATVHLTLPCGDVRPWCPEDPALYSVSAVLYLGGRPADDLIDRIGFREIRTEGRRILLNDVPLKLKGFNRHEEYGTFGLSVPPEAMMQDIHLLKDLGANCVRTCHYPNDPRFLDLCDETGLLVWEESHVRGFTEDRMRHPLFMPQLLQCTREMVEQHFNHPSVFIWGSLNECADDTEYGADCYRKVFSLLRSLDPSRPVTAALLERPGTLVCADCDIVSINLYPQWYHSDPVKDAISRKLAEICSSGGRGKPVIISEIGAGAVYGFHDPFGNAKWSEERQSAILLDQIQAVLGHPDVTGLFVWQFCDVRVDESWAFSRPRSYNNKGVVDEYRRPKLSYQTVKRLFRDDLSE